MGRIRSFLGVFVFLFAVLFANNSFAAGYTCSTMEYVSCNAGYYLSASGVGNSCNNCTAVASDETQSCTESCTADCDFKCNTNSLRMSL